MIPPVTYNNKRVRVNVCGSLNIYTLVLSRNLSYVSSQKLSAYHVSVMLHNYSMYPHTYMRL